MNIIIKTMFQIIHCAIIFCIGLFIFGFFYFSDYHSWNKDSERQLYIWTNKTDELSWIGGEKGEFAYGKGKIKDVNGYISDVDLIYGIEKEYFITLGSSNNKYAGEFGYRGFKKIPNGRGVCICSDGQVYAGEFSYGEIIEGEHFVNDKLQYEGYFSDGLYSGFGKYFEDGEIVYAGNWVNGKPEGEGTEYHEGAEFYGTYLDGKRNGIFQIKRNGTTRYVNFINDVPDLNNCSVIYNNGIKWEGALTDSYEPTGFGKIIKSDETINFVYTDNGEITGKQEIFFSNGTSYDGELIAGKRNGYGVQSYLNGITYYGEWKDDEASGYGELVFDDDWYYSGEWKNGYYDGDGDFYFPNVSYEGSWVKGKKHGYGTLTLYDLRYEGYWENDHLNGEGYITYSDGSYYEGEWKSNKRNGYGEYVWADGSSYYGQWNNDLPNGEGEINLSNGDFYTGEFYNGYFSGAGTYTFVNGERYEGEFFENKKHGKGLYYFANGNSYIGEFKDNFPDGKGRFNFVNGVFYEGEFKNGQINGKGSLFIPEGNDYTIIISDNWLENNLPAKGKVLFANGDEFAGVLANGMPTKDGEWTTREDRLKNRTKTEVVRDYYAEHEQTVDKCFSIVQGTIIGINVATTAAEFIPFPPLQVIGMAIDKICDLSSCIISGAHIAIKSVAFKYDLNKLKKSGASTEEIDLLKEKYKQDVKEDLINIGITTILGGIQFTRASKKAAQAVKTYPKLNKAIKAIDRTEEFVKTAEKGKFTDKLVRGVVSKAYGKPAKKIINEYGDDAARLLFKYGDNALYALTKGGDAVIKILKTQNEQALKIILEHGEDAVNILSKNIDNLADVTELITKKGNAGIKLLEASGDSAGFIAKQFTKYGDDFFEIAQIAGKNGSKNLANLSEKFGDDIIEILLKVKKENPKNLRKAIKYIDAKGIDGIHDIMKWNGRIPDHITHTTIRLAKKRYQSQIKAATDLMLNLPAIKLSTQEMDMIRKNPEYLRSLVKQYTGKSFNKGYKEFFIRMSKQHKNQIEEIWNYNTAVQDFIKRGIRNGSGKHEWLMCSNFCQFLTDPKWRKDGPYLANIIDQLATDTSSVIMSNGWSHAAESLATRGSPRNPKSVIHNGIRQIVKESNDADELIINLRKWIKNNFTQETYDAFEYILEDILE